MATNLQYLYGADPNAGQNGLGAFYWKGNIQKRKEAIRVKRNMPVVFESVYGCNPMMLEGSVFTDKDFAFFRPPPTLSLGKRGLPKAFLEKVEIIVQSWDTAYSARTDADYSVCLTAALVPCSEWHTEMHEEGEECDPHFDVYMLDEFREKLDFADLPEAAKLQYAKWGPSVVLVEQRATGVPLISTLEATDVPIRGGEKATRSKKSRAIIGASAGSTQGWMRQHRVLYPADAPWFDDHRMELKAFTGEGDEIDDRVDSLTQLVNFAIEEGSQTSMIPSDSAIGGEPSVERAYSIETATNSSPENPLSFILGLDTTANEMMAMCANCRNFSPGKRYCNLHKAPTVAIHSCIDHEFKE